MRLPRSRLPRAFALAAIFFGGLGLLCGATLLAAFIAAYTLGEETYSGFTGYPPILDDVALYARDAGAGAALCFLVAVVGLLVSLALRDSRD